VCECIAQTAYIIVDGQYDVLIARLTLQLLQHDALSLQSAAPDGVQLMKIGLAVIDSSRLLQCTPPYMGIARRACDKQYPLL